MSIYSSSDYRQYLKAYIKKQPKRGRGFVLKIAGELRMHPTMVSQILSGKKDFTLEQAHQLCHFLMLNETEMEYFLLMVQRERSSTQSYKKFIEKKMQQTKLQSQQIASRIEPERTLSESEKSIFYSHWIYSAVRLFCSKDDGYGIDAVMKRFNLDRNQASRILKFLAQANLVKEESGLFSIGPMRTHLDPRSPFIGSYHSQWRLKAIERSSQINDNELMFTSPISLSRLDFMKIREALVQMIDDNMKIVRASPVDDVACFTCDLFWV